MPFATECIPPENKIKFSTRVVRVYKLSSESGAYAGTDAMGKKVTMYKLGTM